MEDYKRRIVIASGVFDLVHYGHVRFLEEAKKAGGKNAKFIVIVARDKTVLKMKKRKPVMPEDHRRAVIEALKPVDEAVLGFEDLSFKETIKSIKPDVIAIGYDQTKIEKEVKKAVQDLKADLQIVRIGRFGSLDLDSSSKIRRKILKLAQGK